MTKEKEVSVTEKVALLNTLNDCQKRAVPIVDSVKTILDLEEKLQKINEVTDKLFDQINKKRNKILRGDTTD